MEAVHVWYKDGATVVAAVALAVSLVSSLISMWHTRAQDQQTAHVDLRAVLQRLLSVSLETRERIEGYQQQIAGSKGDARTIALANANIDFVNTLALQEMNVLASQGAKSVRLLGKKLVASPEYLTIARAQEEAGNFEAQAEFIGLACSTAKTPNDKLGASRDSAVFLYKTGRVKEGRAEFETQVEILKKATYYAPEMLARANVSLQLVWAGMEAAVTGDMKAAQEHVDAATSVAEGVGPGPLQDSLKQQIDAAVKGPSQGGAATA